VKKLTLPVVLVFTLLLALPVWACSVPVFRYALERWAADPYEVVIFHRGELSAAEQAIVGKLSPEGKAGTIHANLNATVVDLDADPDPKLVEYWETLKSDQLPTMVVNYPAPTRIPVPAYVGAFNDENVERLLDSPVRREIARRLLTGDTAVLVLLESGDKTKDDAAFQLVETHAQQMAQTLELPEIDVEDLDEVSVDPAALKLQFSTIRLSRNDPAEAMLVEMLLGSEEDLHGLQEPMAFPVFGRGRVLYALIGAGITTENVQQSGVDLTGPCTCTVKDQNPGVDLVMAVDWDELVQREVEIDKELPPLAGLGGFATPTETKSEIETEVAATEPVELSVDESPQETLEKPTMETGSTTAAETTATASSPIWRNLIWIGVAAIAVVVALSLVLFRKQA